MSRVVNREACPECRKDGGDKKGDNKIVYEDSSAYCFSCELFFPSKENTNITSFDKALTETNSLKSKFIYGEYRSLTERGISEKTCKFFKYQVTDSNDRIRHIANYYDPVGTLRKQKIRLHPKGFYNIFTPRKRSK